MTTPMPELPLPFYFITMAADSSVIHTPYYTAEQMQAYALAAIAAATEQSEEGKLLQIIAAMYQIAGVYDAPEHVLDVLANPEGATQEQIDALLPFAQPKQPATVHGEPVARVAEVHMSRYTLEWTNGPLPEGTQLYTTPQPLIEGDAIASQKGGQS